MDKPVDKIISQTNESIIKDFDKDGNEYETTVHKIELDISTLEPGTTLSVPSYDKDGKLIKEANSEFTEADIKTLKQKNIKFIFYSLKSREKIKSTHKTKLDTKEKIDEDPEYIIGRDTLNIAMGKIYSVFNKVKSDDHFEMNNIYNIIDLFYNSIKYKKSYKLLLLDTKNKQEYLYSSAINVCILSMFITVDYQSDEKTIKNMGIASLLRDVGLVKFPKKITEGAISEFTKQELELYKKHPQMSCNLLTNKNKYIGIDPLIIKSIQQHHEFLNGSGFPNKLSGEKIDAISNIITISDKFDYITRNNNLSHKLSYRDALVYIYENMNKLFDTRIASLFIKNIANKLYIKYLFGDDFYLILNTGEIAIIEEENPHNILKPKLKIIIDQNGKKVDKMYRIDLKADIDRKIIKVKKRIKKE